MKCKDMKGLKFGHLTPIQRSTHTNAAGQVYWVCRCDCGRFLVVRGDNLRRGISTACTDCSAAGRRSRFLKEGEESGLV